MPSSDPTGYRSSPIAHRCRMSMRSSKKRFGGTTSRLSAYLMIAVPKTNTGDGEFRRERLSWLTSGSFPPADDIPWPFLVQVICPLTTLKGYNARP